MEPEAGGCHMSEQYSEKGREGHQLRSRYILISEQEGGLSNARDGIVVQNKADRMTRFVN